tara:strand:+ start:72 stop:4136 length:4065 start_codon:yes stop_codon:yes gene_type:complete
MSNNSWKQYGGISDLDNYNFINANTIIADQFVSRSTKPDYQFFNGIFEVSSDLSAGVNVIAGNSILSSVDLFVNRDIYSNNKIYFGGNSLVNNGNVFPVRDSATDAVYIYGDASYIGVNTLQPKTIFNINATLPTDTDILTIENQNDYIRNIIAQNKNERGIVIDASNATSNIHFYIDSSTNISNAPNASISYNINGSLLTTTTNEILQSSRQTRIDTSGGTIFMSDEKTQIDSSGDIILTCSAESIIMSASRGFILDTSGGFFMDTSGSTTLIDRSNGDINIDSSGQYVLHCSGGYFNLNDNNTQLASTGTILVHASGGFIEVDSSGGIIEMNSQHAKFNTTFLDISDPDRAQSTNLYDETLTVCDNSNVQFFKNVYNDATMKTGTAIVGVGVDSSANTFMKLVPNDKLDGAAYGGGVYPYDTERSMNFIGLNDSSGNLVPNQMIVEGNNKAKYVSTLGINTFTPKTEQYVVDMNGPLRVANGEINTIAEVNFEISTASFSKENPQLGFIVGTPSDLTTISTTDPSYKQVALFTNNGGVTWNKSDIYENDAGGDNELRNFTSSSFSKNSLGIIAGNNRTAYYTINGGEKWYPMIIDDNTTISINTVLSVDNGNTVRIFTPYINLDNDTRHFMYSDITDEGTDEDSYPDADSQNIIIPTDKKKNSSNIDFNISASSAATTYSYFAGDGIFRLENAYSYTDNFVISRQKTDGSYNAIHALDDDFVVAVGNDIISYTTDGGEDDDGISTWHDISLSDVTHLGNGTALNLNDVFVKDKDKIIAVGDNGILLYVSYSVSSNDEPEADKWKIIPDTILNTNGMANRLNSSENKLVTVDMTDDDTFIISSVLTQSSDTTDDTNDIVGFSKVQYTFLPNLFNRDNNTVMDICGNMAVSGNMDIIDGRLFVGQSSTFQGDVYMNNRLFVETSDLEVTGNLKVQGSAQLTNYSEEYITTIHTTNYAGVAITEDMSLNGTLEVYSDSFFYSTGAIRIPRGNDSERPISSTETDADTIANSIGYIRYNTENSQFEGYGPGNSWGSLGGVINVAKNTYITAEDSANSRNNQLKFYTILNPDADDGILRMIIDSSGAIGVGTSVPKTIFQIDGTDALRIPVGDEAEKDNFENLAGQIRYNSTNSQFEGYGPGNSWGSLGGVINVAQNTKIIASDPDPDSTNNQLKFFTADLDSPDINAATQRMMIDNTGSVGIGDDTHTPDSSYLLDVDGDVQAVSYNATSDERLKENIKPIMNSLSKIVDLRGVNFTWIEDSSKNLQSGLIAQEVESVISEAVTTGSSKNKNGFNQKSINYSAIVPYLIEAVKELSIENQNLKRDLENLRIKEEENTENIKKYDKLISEIMDKLDK